MTDALRVSGGVRLHARKTRTTSARPRPSDSLLPAFNGTYPFRPPTASFDDTSFMASVDYQLNDDTLLYARYAQGFKSGGYNGRANSAAECTRYDPETADTFEVGFKATGYATAFA